MTPHIRAFIAIDLNETIKTSLEQVQKTLASSEADVKWTEKASLHMTLKFLGDISPDQVEPIAEVMTRVVATTPKFSFDITELGAFPDILFPKIIWAGVGQNAETLEGIARRLEEELLKLKIKKDERAFSAHITLGRTRSTNGKDRLVAALEETNLPSGLSQAVGGITLFQSLLTPQGPVYTALKNAPLK
ncbi:MAG: RNA 2',3'-cyclic phosphodiesterase [Elusimicrobia bacterium]|nr:RNA 2',3'-cyclic phosphodiesterase [Elusimicrobiota bacterium]